MKLYIPTHIYCEKNAVENHQTELTALGTKAMIVTGKHSSRKNGSLAQIEKVLDKGNVPYVIFDDIEENPSIETVMEARKIGVDEKVDFVIGVGGGSPMDASKAIALMVANPDQDENILYEAKVLPYLPLAEIPTTAGTGSEVTPYSILTIHAKKTKQSISHKIYPTLALTDYEYLKTVNRNCLVNTAVDTLAHLVESFLNTSSNTLNRAYSAQGLWVWGKVKEHLLKDTLQEEDYPLLTESSTLGGMSIAHTGTSLPHGLSYAVTYEMGLPHGKAVGIFLGGFVRIYKNQEDVRIVMELLGFSKVQDFVNYIYELIGKVELSEELIQRDADEILKNQAKLANYPFKITKKELIQILRQ